MPAAPAAAPSVADPVPVGIADFGMTTFILSCANAGFFGGTQATPMMLGLAIFYGGLLRRRGAAAGRDVGLPQG